MRALTLRQPWAYAMVRLGKRIENRSWAPGRVMLGHWIAIHAGVRLDNAACDRLECYHSLPNEFDVGVVVAVARLDRIVRSSAELRAIAPTQLCWYTGRAGWYFGRVLALSNPVPCRGRLNLWNLTPEQCRLVVRRINGVCLNSRR